MKNKTRLLVFVDEANVTRAASKNFKRNFDWLKFRDYLENQVGDDRQLVEMVIYVGLPPATPEWMEKREAKRHYIHWLRSQGFMVYEKSGQPRANGWYKANVDVIMAIDAIDLSLRIKPDTVVLVTGDADFAHLATTIRREGIKVEVASVPQTLSSELKTSASSIIDLSDLFLSFEPFEFSENDAIMASEDYY
ncbi:NYN domain-containing protein [Deltaproteobacteria bacterium Smac51]|nr:NYN domain-containing protein [Deltaproteobacteria bacterium Smac51]